MIPTLTDYQTGEAIRPATRGEHLRSRDAERANGTGAFLLEGRSVFVAGDFATEPTRLFRITNPASGANLGTYAGKTKAAALDNYAYTAGYDSFAAACEVTGDDAEDDAGLSVVEVEADRLPSFSFDGFGVNGPDEYRTRIATFDRRNMSETDRNKWGRMFAAAPDLLAALRALVARCDTTELADGSSIDTLAATMAIRLAEGGE